MVSDRDNLYTNRSDFQSGFFYSKNNFDIQLQKS